MIAHRIIFLIILGTACLSLSACDYYWRTNHFESYFGEKYLVRRDTATSWSGDSVAANSAIQIPDPWPPGSKNPNIAFDAEKTGAAIERYKEDKEFLRDQKQKNDVDLANIGGGLLPTAGGPGPGEEPAPAAGAAAAQPPVGVYNTAPTPPPGIYQRY